MELEEPKKPDIIVDKRIVKREVTEQELSKKSDGTFILKGFHKYRIEEVRIEFDYFENTLTRNQYIGMRLKRARTSKIKTLEDCGEAISKSPQTIQRYEEGESSPTFDNLLTLCEFLKIDPKALL